MEYRDPFAGLIPRRALCHAAEPGIFGEIRAGSAGCPIGPEA
jgi:hypothetical protein